MPKEIIDKDFPFELTKEQIANTFTELVRIQYEKRITEIKKERQQMIRTKFKKKKNKIKM